MAPMKKVKSKVKKAAEKKVAPAKSAATEKIEDVSPTTAEDVSDEDEKSEVEEEENVDDNDESIEEEKEEENVDSEEADSSSEEDDAPALWSEFGARYLDRRITRALTKSLGLEKPTLVQAKSIPLSLEGKDVLCKARTGSGKTLAYLVPMVNKILVSAANRSVDSSSTESALQGVVLVPTKELSVQVHQVLTTLLSFCYDDISCDYILAGQKYMKSELPTILVCSPSSLTQLLGERSLKLDNLKLLAVDEADLMYTYGYEEDMEALKNYLPSSYQAMLCSATLTDEVSQLKSLVLHKPVTLKLEEQDETTKDGDSYQKSGQLTQYYLPYKQKDKFLVLYALLKLKLLTGKTLLFTKDIESAYQVKLFLERFSINSAVLNSDLSHKSRQNVIQSFNQALVDLVIATDEGFEEGKAGAEEDSDDEQSGDEDGEEDDSAEPKGLEDMEWEDESSGSEEEEEEMSGEMSGESESADGEKKAGKKADTKKGKKEESDDEEGDDFGAEFSDMEEGSEDDAEMLGEDMDDDEEDDDEDEENDVEAEAAAKEVADMSKKDKKVAKKAAKKQFSAVRGLDFKNVGTVFNFDMPETVRSYVHRVGRTARGGQDGACLSLVDSENDAEMALLETINENLEDLFDVPAFLASSESEGAAAGENNTVPNPLASLQLLPLRMQDISRLRYRVEDVFKSVTKKAVRAARVRELQQEALNSAKLQAHFEDNPQDLYALQKAQREFKTKKHVQRYLSDLPSYLIPESLLQAKTPVQMAVSDQGIGGGSGGARRRRAFDGAANSNSTGAVVNGKKKKHVFTRSEMVARSRKKDPTNTDVERLPGLSGRKIWKMNHKKRVKKTGDGGLDKTQFMSGRKSVQAKGRKKKFPGTGL